MVIIVKYFFILVFKYEANKLALLIHDGGQTLFFNSTKPDLCGILILPEKAFNNF